MSGLSSVLHPRHRPGSQTHVAGVVVLSVRNNSNSCVGHSSLDQVDRVQCGTIHLSMAVIVDISDNNDNMTHMCSVVEAAAASIFACFDTRGQDHTSSCGLIILCAVLIHCYGFD